LFGLQKIWRDKVHLNISDPSRTVVDLLDKPALGGDLQHVSEVLENYFLGDLADEALLLRYIEQFGNGAIYKRLGLIAERLQLGSDHLLETCQKRLTRGLAKLDPDRPDDGEVNHTWGVIENVRLRSEPRSNRLAVSDRTVAREFKRRLAALGPILDLRVFGSRARGEAAPDSDLDVFIEVETLTPQLRRRIDELAWEVGFELDCIISPIVATRDQLERGPMGANPLVLMIEREGIRP
jgi:predicted nucleotidyltransferase